MMKRLQNPTRFLPVRRIKLDWCLNFGHRVPQIIGEPQRLTLRLSYYLRLFFISAVLFFSAALCGPLQPNYYFILLTFSF